MRYDRNFVPGQVLAFRAAVAAAFAFALSAGAYAWVRALEAAIFPRADPRAIVIVTQGGYLVRCAAAAFTGGMGLFAGYWLSASPRRAARAVCVAAAIAAAAIGLQAGLLP